MNTLRRGGGAAAVGQRRCGDRCCVHLVRPAPEQLLLCADTGGRAECSRPGRVQPACTHCGFFSHISERNTADPCSGQCV